MLSGEGHSLKFGRKGGNDWSGHYKKVDKSRLLLKGLVFTQLKRRDRLMIHSMRIIMFFFLLLL